MILNTLATRRSSSRGPARLRDRTGAMDAVGFSAELEDDRIVHQPVQKSRCQRRVPQVIGPRFEIDIGRQGGRTPSRAGVQQAIVERTGLSRDLALQPIEPEFIDQ
jgi:hypothetical protein